MKILVTAGATREPIDAVRFIGNRSSGRMGLALAQAVVAAGHDLTLLLGAVAGGCDSELAISPAAQLDRFDSTSELHRLLQTHWSDHDVLIMSAAVADFRPRSAVEGKMDRSDGPVTVVLEPTVDLVANMAARKRPDQFVVAFALEEPACLERRAVVKMTQKGVDAIVANPLATIGGNHISPLWLTAAGDRQQMGQMTKSAFAQWLIRKIDRIHSLGSDIA